HQIFPGGRTLFDSSRRRNVIGRDGVAENAQRARPPDFGDVAGLHGKAFEEGRVMNVIAFLVPLINVTCARWNFVPLRVLLCEITIEFAERFRCECGLHGVPDLAKSRPEIAKESFFAVLVLAKWV